MARRVTASTAAILSSQQQQQHAEEPINPSHHYQQARGASSNATKRSSYADVVSSSQGATWREEGRLEEGMAEGLDDEEERVEGRCCDSDGTEGEGEDEEGDDDDGEDRIEVVQIPYRILLLRYLLIVPPLALICLLGLIAMVTFGWPPPLDSSLSYPHYPNFPLLLCGLAFFSLAHSLRLPIYTFLSLLPLRRTISTIPNPSSPARLSTRPSPLLSPLSAVLHTLTLELLRYLSIAILLPPLQTLPNPHPNEADDIPYPDVWQQWDSFEGAFWLGFGWALGEVGVGIWQGYYQLTYYAPILPEAYPSQSAFSLPSSLSFSQRSRHLYHQHQHQQHQPQQQRQRVLQSALKRSFPPTASTTAPPPPPPAPLLPPTSFPSTGADDHPRSPSRTPTNASFPPLPPTSSSSSAHTAMNGDYITSPDHLNFNPTNELDNNNNPNHYPSSSDEEDNPQEGEEEEEEEGEEVAAEEDDELADLETQIANLLAVQQREAVESVLGVPLPNVPAIISALWRIDGIFLNLGITLIMASLHLSPSFPSLQLYLLLTALALAHSAVSVFWVVGMRRLGPPTTTYASFFVALGSFIWGLGGWRALV